MNNLSQDFDVNRLKLLQLLKKSAYKKGNFTLSSGRESNHYFNCKPVSLNGYGLNLISNLFLELIEDNCKTVAGLTLGADPLVSGVIVAAANKGLLMDGLIIRKEIKSHGTKSGLEGPNLESGVEVIVLEDVVTTAGSCLKAIRKLRENNFSVKKVLSIVDREEGGSENLFQNDIRLKSLFNMNDFI